MWGKLSSSWPLALKCGQSKTHKPMKFSSKISGVGRDSLGQLLKDEGITRGTSALGVASAFVTIGGFRQLLALTRRCKGIECRLLAGISNAITHPKALEEALNSGWSVRLGSASKRNIFHPKLIVCGRSFRRDGRISDPSFLYVGSSNLTRGGLQNNVECGIVAHADSTPPSVAPCFAVLWNMGQRATQERVEQYAEEFARRNRRRSLEDMEALGVSDTLEEDQASYEDLSERRAATLGEAMPESAAIAAWTGLESFTGEYRFQVEFPQAAGQVLKRIVGGASGRDVPILCSGDNSIRLMSYRFYPDNGMFRLNIPNDTPGVQVARQSHSGIAIVEATTRAGADAALTILPPGRKLDATVKRSYLLGTWGNTPTRAYGWY